MKNFDRKWLKLDERQTVWPWDKNSGDPRGDFPALLYTCESCP